MSEQATAEFVLSCVVGIVRAEWHEARRWEQPLELPRWVSDMRTAMGDKVICGCQQCADSDRREAYYKVNRW